jgi:ankyrin repeat protein
MFPVPATGNLASAPVPVPIQAPAQQHGNPAPQVPNTAPQVNNVVVPDDPRGTKRSRENNPQDSDEPVLKLARTEPAAAPDGPEQKLIKAIESGDLSGVQMLLRQSPQLLNSYLPGNAGPTPLCLAAKCGQKEIAGFLLSSGSPINAPSRNGTTPLMFASQWGHVEVIRQLCLLGADPLAIYPSTGLDTLAIAIYYKQLGACKELIANGADMTRLYSIPGINGGPSSTFSPLRCAIGHDFGELVDWWLDSNELVADTQEPSTSTTLLNLAVSYGALTVIRSLLQRGADPDTGVMITQDNKQTKGIWAVAFHFHNWEVIEWLLSEGYRINLTMPANSALCLRFGFGIGSDICIQLVSKAQAKTPADRITNAQLRQHPEKAIEGLVASDFFSSNLLKPTTIAWWCDQGLLSVPFGSSALIQNFIAGDRLLGQNVFYPERFPSITGATQAQQLQMLVEFLSDTICSPDWPQRFSGWKLTPQGEQTMNQIAVAQGELLLKGVANLREQFEKQVASLPSLCMISYITLAHQINEPDLYRKMTREWGLYDPVARAAIRLVKEAYEKLRALPSQRIPPEFAAMSPSEQLRHVMVELLEDWDKIPELVETLLKCDAQALDVVSDLLFQQWRLIGEAFGVTKPRYSKFGPHRLEAEPVMEVDEGHPTTRATVPLTPIPLTPQ